MLVKHPFSHKYLDLMHTLAYKYNMTTHISVFFGFYNIIIHKETLVQNLDMNYAFFDPKRHHYCSAPGKLLLSTLSEPELKVYFEHAKLIKFNKTTLATEEEIRKELEKIKKVGFSTHNEEFLLGNFTISFPLWLDGKVKGAFSFMCPISEKAKIYNQKAINDIKTRGEDTPLSSLGLQVSPAYNVDYKEISFDVTDVIKEKCTDNLITFTLWTGTGREQVIASKEYSGTDAQGPTLVLEFEGEEPTPTPTVVPTATPTLKPTPTPTVVPTATPTLKPTATPTVVPTATPTLKPTATPTVVPTATPTATPTLKPTTIPTAIPTVIPTTTPNLANNKITAMINSNNKLDVTLDFENVDMNDVNVYVAFKNNGKLVGMKMPQASELKGIELIDKEYTDIEVYAWDNKQKPYANIVRIVNNVQ